MKRPKKPTTVMWLGIAFIALGFVALPIPFRDPTETTNLGIPVLIAIIGLWIGGAYFAILGGVWRWRDKKVPNEE